MIFQEEKNFEFPPRPESAFRESESQPQHIVRFVWVGEKRVTWYGKRMEERLIWKVICTPRVAMNAGTALP